MNRLRLWKRNFNWRMFLVRILVNALALLVTALIFPNIYFVDKRFITWLWLALMLGLLNAFIKPIIAFLTLRFIFATGGLVLALINGLILLLLDWLFPTMFEVGGLLAALLGGAVLGLMSAFMEALLGLNPPIVSEKYPEIRERIKDRQFYRTRMVPARLEAKTLPAAGELAASVEVEASAPATEPLAETNTADAPAEPSAANNKTSHPSTAADSEA